MYKSGSERVDACQALLIRLILFVQDTIRTYNSYPLILAKYSYKTY